MTTVALAYDPHLPAPAGEAAFREALGTRGADVRSAAWDDESAWDEHAAWADLTLLRSADLDPQRRERLLAWAQQVAEVTQLATPLDVLRWNSHRSFLLELEERGAPVVPTAWLAQGDRIDLPDLLRTRGWSQVEVLPAVGRAGSAIAVPGRGACAVAAGQGSLDHTLASGDALVRPLPEPTTSQLAVVVVHGHPPQVLAVGPDREQRVDDDEAAALAAWVVEATGITLPLSRVTLRRDGFGALELVELDAVGPDLSWSVLPEVADPAASAVLAAGTSGPV